MCLEISYCLFLYSYILSNSIRIKFVERCINIYIVKKGRGCSQVTICQFTYILMTMCHKIVIYNNSKQYNVEK